MIDLVLLGTNHKYILIRSNGNGSYYFSVIICKGIGIGIDDGGVDLLLLELLLGKSSIVGV